MISLTQANEYFVHHLQSKKWSSTSDQEKQSVITMAENLIIGHFPLRTDAEATSSYFHAVCEQAIHLLVSDKDLFQLQQQGVKFYGFDGLQVNMLNGLFSPIVKGFLKPIVKAKVGDIL